MNLQRIILILIRKEPLKSMTMERGVYRTLRKTWGRRSCRFHTAMAAVAPAMIELEDSINIGRLQVAKVNVGDFLL